MTAISDILEAGEVTEQTLQHCLSIFGQRGGPIIHEILQLLANATATQDEQPTPAEGEGTPSAGTHE